MDELVLTDREELLVKRFAEIIADRDNHACAFNPNERKVLHDFIDACDKEGADGETHIIILRIGNNVRDYMKKATKSIIFILITSLMFLFYHLVVRPLLSGVGR